MDHLPPHAHRKPVERLQSWTAARVDEKTTRLANRTEPLVRALNSAATRLDEDGVTSLAGHSRRAANRLHHLAAYLRDENPTTMLNDVSARARAHPAAFVWASFAAGLVLGRILRNPAPTRDDTFANVAASSTLLAPPLGGP